MPTVYAGPIKEPLARRWNAPQLLPRQRCHLAPLVPAQGRCSRFHSARGPRLTSTKQTISPSGRSLPGHPAIGASPPPSCSLAVRVETELPRPPGLMMRRRPSPPAKCAPAASPGNEAPPAWPAQKEEFEKGPRDRPASCTRLRLYSPQTPSGTGSGEQIESRDRRLFPNRGACGCKTWAGRGF
jgi:hypothetical protein